MLAPVSLCIATSFCLCWGVCVQSNIFVVRVLHFSAFTLKRVQFSSNTLWSKSVLCTSAKTSKWKKTIIFALNTKNHTHYSFNCLLKLLCIHWQRSQFFWSFVFKSKMINNECIMCVVSFPWGKDDRRGPLVCWTFSQTQPHGQSVNCSNDSLNIHSWLIIIQIKIFNIILKTEQG